MYVVEDIVSLVGAPFSYSQESFVWLSATQRAVHLVDRKQPSAQFALFSLR